MSEKKETKSKQEKNAKPEEEGRYTTLQELEKNLWTHGSPIIVEKGVLENDKVSNKNRVNLKFTNIFPEAIRDVYLTVIAKDPEGNVSEIDHSYKALGQKYLSTKGVAKLTVDNKEANEFKVRLDRVVFEDGRIWEKADAILESQGEIEDVEAFAEENLKEYEDAYKAGLNEIQSDDTNHISEGIAILEKIHWYKDSDERLADAYKKFEAAKQIEERKRNKEDSIKKREVVVKKRFKIAIAVVIAVAILVVLSVVSFFIPNIQYGKAKKLLKQQNYAAAAKEFDELNGFLKSEDYEAECYYNIGVAYLKKGDEVNAKKNFQKAYDADPNSDYGETASSFLDYYKGEEALKNNQINDAYKYFKKSADSASDINLANKASVGFAQVSFVKGNYKDAWNSIQNVYSKDPKTFKDVYAKYGYEYAKYLIGKEKYKKGLEVYNRVAKLTNAPNLNQAIYNKAVALAGKGNIAAACELLEKIGKSYPKAARLNDRMYKFDRKVKGWLGLWKHHGKVKGKKKTYRIYIKEVLYKGKMCLWIKDQNNKRLGFETIISDKNHVTQIEVTPSHIHFKLKRYDDQKFTYNKKVPNKMVRIWKYGGDKFKTKYKRKVK
ncbi:MAG: tetratricopeptide repeat protein [Eubacterium sp.]|nr:tetratricopeptide repeat protein [Eubacterium sp.]